MSNDPNAKFDDPVLKAAIKRACGRETAPPQLRGRIRRALDPAWASAPAASSATRTAAPVTWRNNRLVGLAAAAVIVLCIGLIYNYMADRPAELAVNLPPTLANAMVVTAEMGSAAAEVNLVQDPNNPDYPGMAKTLRERLNHPVLATPLGVDWKLKSAGVADIDGLPVSQLVFVRGNDQVSLFSLDARKSYASQEGADYDQVQNGHPISGFVYKGAVHCVVGGKNMSRKEVTKLRDQLRTKFTAMQTTSNTGCGAKSDPTLQRT